MCFLNGFQVWIYAKGDLLAGVLENRSDKEMTITAICD
jgi:hypothetical protein